MVLLWGCQNTPKAPKSWENVEIEKAAGMCCPYRVPEAEISQAPDGYRVVFLNHFGRHGSRYHTWDKLYSSSLAMLKHADSLGVLSPKGIELLTLIKEIEADSKDRIGDLTQRGLDEQRGIAFRTYNRFEDLFKDGNLVRTYSTKVHRTILSMTAFVEELSKCSPNVDFVISASSREQAHLIHAPNAAKIHGLYNPAVEKFGKTLGISTERFSASIIKDKDFLSSHKNFCDDLYFRIIQVALILPAQGYPMGIDLIPWFTKEELMQYWERDNYRLYLECGPSFEYGKLVTADAIPLMQEFINSTELALQARVNSTNKAVQAKVNDSNNTAQTLVSDANYSAIFRFGHDLNFVPFISLLNPNGLYVEIEDPTKLADKWRSYEISCMATNCQMVFYENKDGDVLVQVLLNEKEVSLPIPAYEGKFYKWLCFKKYLEDRIALFSDYTK